MSDLILGTGVSFGKESETARAIIASALVNGIYKFDTAPSYKTESILGDILYDERIKRSLNRDDLYIQTKIDAWQMQDGNIRRFIEQALEKLRVEYLDALLIHWPIPEYIADTWEKMICARKDGLVKKIGICNVRLRQLKQCISLSPNIIQIERHPLNTFSDEVLFCNNNKLEIQAYSPLCKMDDRIKNNEIIKRIARKYGKDEGQIVLRWHLDTGVIPIFTTTKTTRVESYASITDFVLTNEEIEDINRLNVNYKMYLESISCPGF